MTPEDLLASADYDYLPLPTATGSQELLSGWEVFFTTVFIPVLYSFIFLLGLAGNLFVILLTARRRAGRRLLETLVLNLAVADAVFVCTLPLWVAAGARGNRWLLGEGLCKVSSYVVAVNRCSSILFLTALAVERYLLMRKVRDARLLGARRHVRLACAAIWAASLLLGSPALLYRQLDGEDCWDEDGEDFGLAMVFLSFLLPSAVISFCYCSICCRLRRRRRLGRGVRRSHRTIAAILAAFLCSWLPLNACKVLLFFLAKGTLVLSQGQEVALRWVVAGSTCLAFANSCVSPLLYALMEGHCQPCCPSGTAPRLPAPPSTSSSSLLFSARIWTKTSPDPQRRSRTKPQAAPGTPRGPPFPSPPSPGATSPPWPRAGLRVPL
ncbi:probable G-protein coupled receptor 25 [Dryobates pubescens]|uniref:probable G-protein coupled receptor 25 n=1 Tax=Dryobates pubescens TaxID=118200 RepID=UPI0023B993A3|nr:probable G-protein coupled receptor 25 [Dryobates pubescens]